MTPENARLPVGLVPALQRAFGAMGSRLVARGLEWTGPTLPPAPESFLLPDYACVRSPNRRCEISVGGKGRSLIFDFWERGVFMADGKTSSLADVAQSVHCWIADRMAIAQMEERFLFFKATAHAKIYEQGREVEASWSELKSRTGQPGDLRLESFIDLAWEHPTLRGLFPYINFFALCFSRCTGYPYSGDCPAVVPAGEGRYAVLDSRGNLLGEGTPVEALSIVVRNLPAGCGPAVKGTAEDLRR